MMFEIRGDIPAGASPRVVCRVRGDDQNAVDPSQVNSWDLTITDLTDGSQLFELLGRQTPLLSPVAVVDGWDLDDVGANFDYRVDATLFGALAGRTYQMLWTLKTTPYGQIGVKALVAVRSS